MGEPKDEVKMIRYERTLILLLRVAALILLAAIIPAVMPFSWMSHIHRQLGLGELPQEPIVHYLTRSLSALYAVHGALVLFISTDVRRYLPVVICLAGLSIILGIGLLVLDIHTGMPWFWILGEGPVMIVFYGIIFWLAVRVAESKK